MNLMGSLTDGQQQMLVPYFRQKFGMQHGDAYPRAGVSDKGGKNAFRVVTEADPMTADVVRSGLTSVRDAMLMVLWQVPGEVQRAAASEVIAGNSDNLQYRRHSD